MVERGGEEASYVVVARGEHVVATGLTLTAAVDAVDLARARGMTSVSVRDERSGAEVDELSARLTRAAAGRAVSVPDPIALPAPLEPVTRSPRLRMPVLIRNRAAGARRLLSIVGLTYARARHLLQPRSRTIA
jgi:hypothetical protein